MRIGAIVRVFTELHLLALYAVVYGNAIRVKVKMKRCIHLIQRLFVVNHHRRSAQVWHVFSRDLTVLPAHPHVHPQSE